MHTTSITQEKKDQIWGLIQKDESLEDIAAKYELSLPAAKKVISKIKKEKIKKKKGRKEKLSTQEKENLKLMYQEGHVVKNIATKFNVSTATVFRLTKGLERDLDVSKRSNRKIPKEDIPKIRERYAEDEKVEDIAMEYGVSRYTIYKYLK